MTRRLVLLSVTSAQRGAVYVAALEAAGVPARDIRIVVAGDPPGGAPAALEPGGCLDANDLAGLLDEAAGVVLGVPVRAGTGLQQGGSLANDIALQGPWREARPMPNGGVSFHAYTGSSTHRHH